MTSPTGDQSLRRPFRLAAIIVGASVLLGLWVYLYAMARSVDLTAQTDIRLQLAHLKSIDSRWNDRLINLRNSMESPRDTDFVSPVTPTTLAITQHELAVRAQSFANPMVNQTLVELKQAFNAKLQSVDRFGLANRQLTSALRKFNEAVAGGARERSYAPLVGAMSALMAQPNANTRQVVEDAITELLNERRGAESIAQRARELAEIKMLEERAFRDSVFATAVGQRIDTISTAIDREFQRVVDDGERYRVYLLYYSALLLALALLLGVRLLSSYNVIRRINNKLQEANESLEERVAERTQELEQALDQLKQSEALLIQSEKMSSLGQMVAGVAHEVNTPLAYVKSSLESVDRQLPHLTELNAQAERLLEMLRAEKVNEAELTNQFGTVSGLLDQMRANQVLPDMKALVRDGLYGIAQISELVNNLRNFARLDRSKLAEFNLNEGIASALMIAKNVVKHKTVKRELGAIPNVVCSPSQINQVLLNLVTNAAQATRDDASGVITIRSGVRGDNQVVLEVEDNGHGIPEDVLPKIFDPFFTTRDVGQGTGLGLSIVYKIVEQHGGRISVISKVGVGTRFTVQLPTIATSGESAPSSVMAAA